MEDIKMEDRTFDDKDKNGRDEFYREAIAVNLIKFVKNPELTLSPLLLNGSWGVGKTEFCYKLINLIKGNEENILPIYVNAYQYDYTDNPLAVLIASISSHIDKTKFTKQVKAILKKDLLNAAIPILKVGGKVAINAVSQHLLKTDAAEFAEEVNKQFRDTSIQDNLKSLEQATETLKAFKDSLEEITKYSSIVMVIDELDRCNPSFALALLEKVKHVFDVPKVFFIFSTNITQLYAIVKKQYGEDIDEVTYLNKFFKFTVDLPFSHIEKENDKEQNNAYRLFADLVEKEGFLQVNDVVDGQITQYLERQKASNLLPANQAKQCLTFWEDLFKHHGISLRQAETFFNNLKIFNIINKDFSADTASLGYRLLCMLGVFIYLFQEELKKNILTNKVTEKVLKRKNFTEELTRKEDFKELLAINENKYKTYTREIAPDNKNPPFREFLLYPIQLSLQSFLCEETPIKKEEYNNYYNHSSLIALLFSYTRNKDPFPVNEDPRSVLALTAFRDNIYGKINNFERKHKNLLGTTILKETFAYMQLTKSSN